VEGHHVELWERGRLVMRFLHDPKKIGSPHLTSSQ
jgi:hypothetical protein